MKNLLRAWKENCRIVGMKTRTKNKDTRMKIIMVVMVIKMIIMREKINNIMMMDIITTLTKIIVTMKNIMRKIMIMIIIQKTNAVRTGKVMIISQEVNDKMNIQMIDNQIIIKDEKMLIRIEEGLVIGAIQIIMTKKWTSLKGMDLVEMINMVMNSQVDHLNMTVKDLMVALMEGHLHLNLIQDHIHMTSKD